MTTRESVEEMLRQGAKQRDIAKKLGVSEAYISKVCKKLEKEGKIKLDVRTSVKLWLSQDNLTKDLSLSSPIPITQMPKLQLDAHRIQRNFKLMEPPDALKLTGLKEIPWENGRQWIGRGFRITNNLLELEGIEVVSHRSVPVPLLEGIAFTMASNIAKSLARLYGLQIDMAGAWSPENLMEVELTEHDMAERVKKKGKIGLHWDENLDMDIWMDKSFGLGGLESNRVAYIQKLTDFTNDLIDNDSWNKLKQQAQVQSQAMTDFARQLELHLSVLTEMKETLKEMRKPSLIERFLLWLRGL